MAKQNSIYSASSAQSITSDAESIDYLASLERKEDRFIPHIDFSTASHFAKFGSAEKYYEDAFTRIHNFYPYDGSKKEKVEWELSSSYLDKYVFEHEYPRSTGYIYVGTAAPRDTPKTAAPFNFCSSSNPQYVYIKGGPNADPYGNYKLELEPGKSTTAISKANLYNTSSKRVSNLKFDPNTGITVEFWLKKDDWGGNGSAARTETIFHLMNSGSTATVGVDRGDFRIYLDSLTANTSSIYVGIASGTIAHTHSVSPGLTDIADSNWHHYAIVNGNSGSYNYVELYVDGEYADFSTGSVDYNPGTIAAVTGALVAAVGATAGAVANDSTEVGAFGWGDIYKTHIDEFRYWKTKRNAREIGRFYIDQVAGGTNTDTANTDLGVYYKFNEGITGDPTIDSTVLDYSGRISNGNFVGYISGLRNTGSAMISASVANTEFMDPIIYTTHPSVVSKLADLKEAGEAYDDINTNALLTNIPAWIIEDDLESGVGNLAKMVQIAGSYLDTLYLQIEALPTLKNISYTKQKEKPFFFNQRLLSDHGFNTEEILTDNSLFAYANNRDEGILFAKNLHNVKNQIYKNIYNNLVHINKTKGTAKSFRNLLRCLGVDEEILRLNVYASKHQDIRTNYRTVASKQKYIDFYNNNAASVYIAYDSSNSYSAGYIQGGWSSHEPAINSAYMWLQSAPMTVESEIVFPKYDLTTGIEGNYTKEFLHYTSSLFGCYIPEVLDPTSVQTGIRALGSGSFQVYAVRDSIIEKNPNVYFLLTGSFGSLTSSYFQDVYQNSKWNFAVKVTPQKSPFFPYISGTTNEPFYVDIEFQGVNTIGRRVINEFATTSSWIDSVNNTYSTFLIDSKRLYIGANRQNFTASAVDYYSDVYVSSLRYWLRDVTRQELIAHAADSQNYGTLHPYQNSFLFQKGGATVGAKLAGSVEVPQMGTLALDWNFDTVTGSDASGQFIVPDFSYGTNSDRYSELSRPSATATITFNNASAAAYDGETFTITSTDGTTVVYTLDDDTASNTYGASTTNIGIQGGSTAAWIASRVNVAIVSSNNAHYHKITVSKVSATLTLTQVGSGMSGNNTVTTSDATDITVYGFNGGNGTLGSQYVGKGINFGASATDVAERKDIYSYRQELPEVINSNDQVEIVNFEEEVFTRESRPIEYFYAFEKSMYRAISEDMINLFATMKDFHNLIGEPVNRYRMNYKKMEKVRQLFFQRASNTPDLDKFLEFYKWIDNSVSDMLNNLVPATAPFASKTRDVIESHVLERNKYWSKFPIIEKTEPRNPRPPVNENRSTNTYYETAFSKIIATSAPTNPGHSPVPTAQQPAKSREIMSTVVSRGSFLNSPNSILGSAGQLANPRGAQKYNPLYWKIRAGTTNPVMTTGDSTIDSARETLREVMRNGFTDKGQMSSVPTLGRVYKSFTVDKINTIGQKHNYDAGFVSTTLKRGDLPVTKTITVDTGSLSIDYFVADPLSNDNFNPTNTIRIRDGIGVATDSNIYQGRNVLPFGIYSSSLQTGYKTALNTYFTGSEINRKFLDNYGSEVQQPLQGPFANANVGGNIYRHNDPFYNNDISGDRTQRSELYNLAVNSAKLTLSRRSLAEVGSAFYRDQIAKRPLVFRNIKTLTASFAGGAQQTRTILGNYTKEYEIVQATTAIAQKGWLRDNYEGGSNFTQTTAEVLFLTGNLNYDVQVRTGSALRAATFKDRFAAPGSPEVSSDGYLDPASLSVSVYNNLNYRNATVRLIKNGEQFTRSVDYEYDIFRTLRTTQSLNAQLRDHTSYGGYDALTGLPSFHKIQRNILKRLAYSGSTIFTQSVYDNGFLQHPIPQSDRQYAWITASLEAESLPFGFILNTSSATFLSVSQEVVQGIRQDFVGINNTFYIPLYFDTNTADLNLAAPAGLINTFPAGTNNIIFNKAGLGPYGYPSWRQLAYNAGWTTQAILGWQKRNNIMSTITRESVQRRQERVFITTTEANPNTYKNDLKFINIKDPAVIDANKSLQIALKVAASPAARAGSKIVLNVPYSNNKQTFANSDVDYLAYFFDENLKATGEAVKDYAIARTLYNAPGLEFESIKWGRKIYPRTQNTFLSGTRARLNYAEVAGTGSNGYGQRDFRIFWRNKIENRLRVNTSSAGRQLALNIFDQAISGGYTAYGETWRNGATSIWPLDGANGGASGSVAFLGGRRRSSNTGSRGSLHKGPVHSDCFTSGAAGYYPIINIHQAGPRFFGTDDWNAMLEGETAHENSNEVKFQMPWNVDIDPWYDKYEDYNVDLKPAAKNSSLIPEFKMSDNIAYYMNFPTNGDFSVELPKSFLKIEGAAITSSQLGQKYNTNFFKEFSTSDFMKDFDIILNDHKAFSDISEISLTCEGFKKLLPYNGFYPVNRAAQLVSLFSQSYGAHITGSSVAAAQTSAASSHSSFVTHSTEAALQSFIQPLFAPGILFNTIKSGIAVDWPVYSTAPVFGMPATGSAESVFLSSSNDFRLKFETLYDMTHFPVDKEIYTVGNGFVKDYVKYNGNKTSDLYRLAINNFLAESTNLYIKGGKPTSFVSKPMSQVSFEEGKTYRMKVELEALPGTVITRGMGSLYLNSALGSLSGTLGRPFGTAVRFADHELTGAFSCFDLCDPAYGPYTPPYYYGKSTAIINYVNRETDTVTPTLGQIINAMTASYTSSLDVFMPDFTADGKSFRDIIDVNSPAITNIMPLSASMNLFGRRILEKSEYDQYGILAGMADPEDVSQFEQLVISTKYECPIILQRDDGPYNGPNYPLATWTTWGVPPSDNSGVVVRIAAVSEKEQRDDNVKCLRTVLFGDQSGDMMPGLERRVGEMPDDYENSIFEAIVAIPFLDTPRADAVLEPYLTDSPLRGGHQRLSREDHSSSEDIDSRRFFRIMNPGSKDTSTGASSVQHLKTMMQKYVFPPSMDFLNNNVDPYAMFVFEFEQKLKTIDLVMMWQGVMPDIMRQVVKQKSSCTIPTTTNEMLSEFLKHCASNISDNSIITSTFNNLKWMVFKVKQRARNNFSAMTADLSDDQRLMSSQTVVGKDLAYSYNWPYDYCSLVELANMTTEIKIRENTSAAALISQREDDTTTAAATTSAAQLVAPVANPNYGTSQNTSTVQRTVSGQLMQNTMNIGGSTQQTQGGGTSQTVLNLLA